MFKISKTKLQKHSSLNIAAKNVLQGWKFAGQPIFLEDQTKTKPSESDNKTLASDIESDIISILEPKDTDFPETKKGSSINTQKQSYRKKSNSSANMLLQQARELVII